MLPWNKNNKNYKRLIFFLLKINVKYYDSVLQNIYKMFLKNVRS